MNERRQLNSNYKNNDRSKKPNKTGIEKCKIAVDDVLIRNNRKMFESKCLTITTNTKINSRREHSGCSKDYKARFKREK